MPSRKGIRKIDSPEVQGEDSWVRLRQPKGRDMKEAMQLREDMIEAGAIEQFETNTELLRGYIVGWNWVDDDGKDLPQPQDAPDIFDELTNDEITWLTEHLMGNPESGN